MAKAVVSDTGPLIALALVDLLPVLTKIFSAVYIPQAVAMEAISDLGKPGARSILQALENGSIMQQSVLLTDEFEELSKLLDRGESEALALALELDAIALIDERRGRKVAAKNNIRVTGTAALLIRAKADGHIEAVTPYLEKLAAEGYRLSTRLIETVINQCGE